MCVSENVVYPIVPNGFADHYPYEQMAISLGILIQHFQTNPYIVITIFKDTLWWTNIAIENGHL